VISQTVGQIQRIDLRLPEGQYNTYFKVSAATQTVWAFTWDAVSGTGAVFSDSNGNGLTDTVSLFIRDGGRGDDDGVADGVIVDPGFVAQVEAVLPHEQQPKPTLLPPAPAVGLMAGFTPFLLRLLMFLVLAKCRIPICSVAISQSPLDWG
jgi:hypothetical protein